MMFLPKIPMKATRAMILIVLSGLYLPAAHAAKTGRGSVEIERPEEVLTETDTFLSAPGNRQAAGKTLRCWQYGRLLYEGSGFDRMTSTDKTAAITVSRQKGDGVSIFNLQDAFCILSDR